MNRAHYAALAAYVAAEPESGVSRAFIVAKCAAIVARLNDRDWADDSPCAVRIICNEAFWQHDDAQDVFDFVHLARKLHFDLSPAACKSAAEELRLAAEWLVSSARMLRKAARELSEEASDCGKAAS